MKEIFYDQWTVCREKARKTYDYNLNEIDWCIRISASKSLSSQLSDMDELDNKLYICT